MLQTKESTKPIMKEKGIMRRELFENRKCKCAVIDTKNSMARLHTVVNKPEKNHL